MIREDGVFLAAGKTCHSGSGLLSMRNLSDVLSVGQKEAFGVPRLQTKDTVTLERRETRDCRWASWAQRGAGVGGHCPVGTLPYGPTDLQ